jgi:hypothetical protein
MDDLKLYCWHLSLQGHNMGDSGSDYRLTVIAPSEEEARQMVIEKDEKVVSMFFNNRYSGALRFKVVDIVPSIVEMDRKW